MKNHQQILQLANSAIADMQQVVVLITADAEAENSTDTGEGETETPPDTGTTPTPTSNYNLLDLDRVQEGKYVTSTDGTVQGSTSQSVSDFITVDPGEKLTITSDISNGKNDTFIAIAHFDQAGKFLRRVSAQDRTTKPLTITMPNDTYSIRLNINHGLATDYNRMIVRGETVLPYKEYRSGNVITPETVEPPTTTPTTPPTTTPPTKPPVITVPDNFKGVVKPDPTKETINLSSYASLDLAMKDAAKKGGANIILPSGNFEVSLVPESDNIRLFGTGNTNFYAESDSAVLYVPRNIRGFKADGVNFSGQRIADALAKRMHVTSIYAMWIWGSDCEFSNFTTQGAIFDALYLRGGDDFNFKAHDFLIGSSNRNSCTISSGLGVELNNGTMRIDKDKYISDGKRSGDSPHNGYILCDIEPNGLDTFGDILFNKVKFINASGGFNKEQIIIQDNHRNNNNRAGVKLINCEMYKEGNHTGRAPYVRVTSDTRLRTIRDIHIDGGVYNNRVIMGGNNEKPDAFPMILEDSSIRNILLDTVNQVTWENTFGNGCLIENVGTANNGPVSKIRTQGNAKIRNVTGHANVG